MQAVKHCRDILPCKQFPPIHTGYTRFKAKIDAGWTAVNLPAAKNMPAFGLAETGAEQLPGSGAVGMNLYGQPFGGINQLHQYAGIITAAGCMRDSQKGVGIGGNQGFERQRGLTPAIRLSPSSFIASRPALRAATTDKIHSSGK